MPDNKPVDTSRDIGLVIFDLDYTLTKQGTWGRFVWMAVKARPHIWLPLLFSAGLAQWRYKRGKLPRIRVKMAMMRWAMVGKTRADLTVMAETFAKKDVTTGFKPGAIETFKHHEARGDTIMIASAAVDILVEPIARRLGVKYFVATDLAWDGEDKLEPFFASENCYGPEKLIRIKKVIAENPALQALSPIVAYSDSKADMPLLEFCERGVAVDPNDKFRKIIEQSETIRIETWA